MAYNINYRITPGLEFSSVLEFLSVLVLFLFKKKVYHYKFKGAGT